MFPVIGDVPNFKKKRQLPLSSLVLEHKIIITFIIIKKNKKKKKISK
jgi:hypothetical protein